MKEVNEVVQKVYGGEKPVPLWLEDEEPNNTTVKRILFTLIIRIKACLISLYIIYIIIYHYIILILLII